MTMSSLELLISPDSAAEATVPPAYTAQWHASEPLNGAISLAALNKVLKAGGIKAAAIDKVSYCFIS